MNVTDVEHAEVGAVFRAHSGRSVATLIGVFSDIELAEDAMQDAYVVALQTWPERGIPPNPGGWITTTARRRALDKLRPADKTDPPFRRIGGS